MLMASPSWRRSSRANASSDGCGMAVSALSSTDADHGTWFPASGETLDMRGDGLSRAKYESRHVQQKLAAHRWWQGSGRARRVSRHGL
jgi:hypothetical protein